MIPSLLFEQDPSDRVKHASSLFSDVRLDTLFSEKCLEVFSTPCSRSEIEKRLSIFQRLSDNAFKDRFFSLYEALTRAMQAYGIYLNARNECERSLSFYSYAKRYLEAIKLALSIRTDDGILSSFNAYCQELAPLCEDLNTALGALEAPLYDILTSRAHLSPIGAFISADTPSDGLMAELMRCARDLELNDLTLPSQRSIDLPEALANAVFALYPEQFAHCLDLIERFCDRLDPEFCEYRFQISFYKAVWDVVMQAASMGIPRCTPELSDTPGFSCHSAYDATLIAKNETRIVPNDICFEGADSFCFLTGANGGGKTTYLRACAINLILALSGCPVFAESCKVYPFDYIGSHFPQDEAIDAGRLSEEQQRVEQLFTAGKYPFLFFNETFSGADEQKGLVLTLDCAERCKNEGVFGLFVTHFHEVNGHGFSVLSTLIEGDEHIRNYKIGKNTGLRSSFADDILKKYRLDAVSLAQRRKPE